MATVQQLLERYLRVPVDYKQKKYRRLDAFLSQFLLDINEHRQLDKLRAMRGVCNILVGEFLVDVHCICSESEEGDSSALQHYLLHGRGCVILRVLNTIGIQSLSSGLELAELLLSILQLCLKFPREASDRQRQTDLSKLADIRTCLFSTPLSKKRRRPYQASKFPRLTEVTSFKPTRTEADRTLASLGEDTGSNTPLTSQAEPLATTKHVTKAQALESLNFSVISRNRLTSPPESSKSRQSSRPNSKSVTSSDSEDNEEPLSRPICGTNLGVFRGLLSAPSSEAEGVEREDEVDSDEEIVPLPDLDIDPMELCALVIYIVQDICHAEQSSLNSVKLVSNAVITSVAELINIIADEISPILTGSQTNILSDGWSELDYILVQKYLLRLLFVTMVTVATQLNGCVLIREAKILNVLATLCERILVEVQSVPELPHEFANNKWRSLLELMSEINEGILMFIENTLLSVVVNPSSISLVLNSLKDYFALYGSKVTQYLVLDLQTHRPSRDITTEQYESFALRLTGILCNVILAMKKVKVNYIHTVKCSRKFHKICDYSAWIHHHHDILGVSYESDVSENEQSTYRRKSPQLPCCVSMLTELMMQLLSKCKEKILLVRLANSLEECGICCCLSPKTMTSYFLVHLETQVPAVRNYILTLWTRFLLEQSGKPVNTDVRGVHVSCGVCDESDECSRDVETTYRAFSLGHLSDSAFSSDDNATLAYPSLVNKWDSLQTLGPYIFHKQSAIGVQVMQHLLRLVSHGSVSLKQALFQHNLLPVLSRALHAETKDVLKTRTSRKVTDSVLTRPVSEKVINYSLSALPLLLQTTEIFNLFINIGGIDSLRQYVKRDLCRKATLKTLMVMVIIEEHNKRSRNAAMEVEILTISPKAPNVEIAQEFPGAEKTAASDSVTVNMIIELLVENELNESLFSKTKAHENIDLQGSSNDVNVNLESSMESVRKADTTASHSDATTTNRSYDVTGVSEIPGLLARRPEFDSGVISDDSGLTEKDSVPAQPLANESCSSSTGLDLTQPLSGAKAKVGCSGNVDIRRANPELCLLGDLWDCAAVLFYQSVTFKHWFLLSGCVQRAHLLLNKCLDFLASCDVDDCDSGGVGSVSPEFSQVLALVRSLLSVCLGSCGASCLAGQWELTPDDLLTLVKTKWLQSAMTTSGLGSKFKAVCDMLLGCASHQRMASDLLQDHVFTVMHLRCDDDVYSRGELSESSSSQESEYTSLDLGYEADSEVTYDDNNTINKSNKWTSIDESKQRTFSTLPLAMPHPEVCYLVLDNLIKYTCTHEQTSVTSHVLLKLISLTKQNAYNATALYSQGMVELVLKRLQQLLRMTSSSANQDGGTIFSVELTLLLDLFLVIAKNSFQAKELRLCLGLFQETSPPLDLLLHTLNVLAENLSEQPNYILCFPAITSVHTSDLELTSRSLSGDTLTISVQVNAGTEEQNPFSRSKVGALQSEPDAEAEVAEPESRLWFRLPYALRAAPLQLPLPSAGPVWPSRPEKGFSLSLWLRVENFKRSGQGEGNQTKRAKSRRQDSNRTAQAAWRRRPQSVLQHYWSENCLHVVSIGNEELLFETWIDTETCNLIFRVMSCYLDNNEGLGILGETCIPVLCDLEKWHHVTLTFQEKVISNRNVIHIGTVLDGCYEKRAELEYSRGRITYCTADTVIRENQLYLGHAATPAELGVTTGSWQLGPMFIFEGIELSKEWSLFLCALGPTVTSLSPCDNGAQNISVAHLISEKCLQYSGLNPDIFTASQSFTADQLREKLLLVFDPRLPGQCLHFDPRATPTPPTTFSLPSPGIGSSALEHARRALSVAPVMVQVAQNTDLAPQVHQGLETAIAHTGGIGVFLFLTAKVLGMTSCEGLQARSLKLLLTLVRRSPALRHELHQLDGYTMFAKALGSTRCRLGYLVLKVLLDYCLTSSVLSSNRQNTVFTLIADNHALVHDTNLISQVLLDWRLWHNARIEVWLTLFQALESLVLPAHPYQSFNIAQLINFDIIAKLLHICLERIQAEYPSLPLEIAKCAISIIRHVINDSRDNMLHHMIALWDFLLLVHPAASTFVHHSPKDFFYINWDSATTVKPKDQGSSVQARHSKDSGSLERLPLTMSDVEDDYVYVDDHVATDYDVTEARESVSRTGSVEEGLGGTTGRTERYKRSISDPLYASSDKKPITIPHSHSVHQVSVVHTSGTGISPAQRPSVLPLHSKVSSNEAVNNSSLLPPTMDASYAAMVTKRKSDSPGDVGQGLITPDNLPQSFASELPSTSTRDEDTTGLYCTEDKPSESLAQLWTPGPSDAVSAGSRATSPTTASSSRDGDRATGQGLSEDPGRLGSSLNVDAELESEAWSAYNDVEHDLGLHVLCAGILEILMKLFAALSDRDLDHVTACVIKPAPLIVMANHCSSKVRAAVIKLLHVYLVRARTEIVTKDFVNMDGLQLLANQLCQYPATDDVTEACFSLLLSRPYTLGDELDVTLLQSLAEVHHQATVPIMALLTCSVHDVALCHILITNISTLLTTVPELLLTMLDHGLSEAVVKVMSQLIDSSPRPTDLGGDESDLLWQDVTDLVLLLVQKTFTYEKTVCFQYLEDFHIMLIASAQKAAYVCGQGSAQERRLHRLVVVTYKVLLTHITDMLETQAPQDKRSNFPAAIGNILARLSPMTHSSTSDVILRTSTTSSSTRRRYSSVNNMATTGQAHSSTPPIKTSPPSALTRSVTVAVGGRTKGFLDSPIQSTLASSSSTRSAVSWLGQRELSDRFARVLTSMVDLVIFSDPLPDLEEEHAAGSRDETEHVRATMMRNSFPCFLLMYIKNAVVMVMESPILQKKSPLVSLYTQCNKILKTQFCRMYCHMLSPAASLPERLFSLALLADEFKCRQLVKQMTTVFDTGHRLVLLLYFLLLEHAQSLGNEERAQAEELMETLDHCRLQPIRLGTRLGPERRRSMEDEMSGWEVDHHHHVVKWLTSVQAKKLALEQKYDQVTRHVRAHALEVTQCVSRAQSHERRKLVGLLKDQLTRRLTTKKAWLQLVQQLTHERAVWFDEKNEPKSWQLDPTEGPGRMRKRLQKCKLGIQPRFLKEQARHKLDCESHEGALSYLFSENIHGSDSKALIYKLHTSQTIQMTSFCKNVKPSGDTAGSLLIGQKDLYFVADEALDNPHHSAGDMLLSNGADVTLYVTLPLEQIRQVHKRWYQLQDNALEVFLTNGQTCLFSFHDTQTRDSVYKFLLSLELTNRLSTDDKPTVYTQRWLEGRLTNFEYLCHLNTLSGRSFNDLMQYPVYPFVLAQYTEPCLDLTDPKSYRSLERPIAVQQAERRQRYVDHYEWLEHEQHVRMREEREAARAAATSAARRGDRGLRLPPQPRTSALYYSEPFHYGSHYSNSGTVLHYLVRLPPFTQMFLEYQDRNFDVPDRTFHSVATTWRLASFESTTDVKELIPEFFFLPEFLCNTEEFNFGMRQSGEEVDNVHLPPWCQGDPELFVRVHRQALESDYVTSHLHGWIDLVFGAKQQGKDAVEAINVFHPATYFGVDVNNIPDVVNRAALKTAIATYGQTPKQLFKTLHPKASVGKSGGGIGSRGSRSAVVQGLPYVQGLRWGTYVGSPACEEPKQRWIQSHGHQVASLVALSSGEVFGLGPCSHLLVRYSSDQRGHKRDVTWAAILSWASSEGLLRIKNKKDQPPVNLYRCHPDEQVTCCASTPDCRLLLLGTNTGVITALSTKFNKSKASHLQVFGGSGQRLFGHTSGVTALCVCRPFSILISASHDKTLIIWDLNRLSYVRSITDHDAGVQYVAVSATMGDIASVSHSENGSVLLLHSVNGRLRGKVTCTSELITCVTFTRQPEGRSINVLAAGLSNGRVRMWSTWNLMSVRDLAWDQLTRPIVALTFSRNDHRLFASAADGTVACWERPGCRDKDVVFIPYLT